MQTKNLSSAQTFGTAIVSLPDDMPCTSHCCVRAGEPIKEWLSQEPVVLDYVSGMPLLVIYEAESYSLYYLDRVFKLRPGVRFSVAALDDLCCFDICTAHPDVLSLLGEHPAEIFYGASSDLKLERLYTFFYQECSRDFYFRGMRRWSWSMSTGANCTIWSAAWIFCSGHSRCCSSTGTSGTCSMPISPSAF